MAQYPKIRYSKQSSQVMLDGRPTARASNGKLRYRVMWDSTKWKFTLHHPAVTRAELDSIVSHYTSHRYSNFAMEFNNSTYTVIYTETPKHTPLGADLYEVTVEFEQE